jgi:hypothetical protein
MNMEMKIPDFPDGATQDEIEVVQAMMNGERDDPTDLRMFQYRMRAAKGDAAAIRVVEIEKAILAIRAKAAREARGYEKPNEEGGDDGC